MHEGECTRRFGVIAVDDDEGSNRVCKRDAPECFWFDIGLVAAEIALNDYKNPDCLGARAQRPEQSVTIIHPTLQLKRKPENFSNVINDLPWRTVHAKPPNEWQWLRFVSVVGYQLDDLPLARAHLPRECRKDVVIPISGVISHCSEVRELFSLGGWFL